MEMNYEEKYNEILEWARKNKARLNGVPIEEVLPELRESEDERITRAINNMLPFIPDEAYANNGVTKEGVLNWLEKQKKPKSDIESGEHKVNTRDLALEAEIKRYTEEKYHETFGNGQGTLDEFDWEDIAVTIEETAVHFVGWKEKEEKQKEQKPVDYEAELKKCKDNPLYFYDKYVSIKQKPAEWSEEEKAIIYGCINRIRVPDKYIDHSNDARSIAFLTSLLNGQRIREGCMGIKGPSCDPGRRGRMGGVPKEISKEAEAFQAQFPAPYDKDDIITAYETAKIESMKDLPKWKEAKTCGKGECFVGSSFEATGRRYPVLFCYGYCIRIEQLFEKLPKEDK